MNSEITAGALTIYLGKFERHTWATADGTGREIRIDNCSIRGSTDDGEVTYDCRITELMSRPETFDPKGIGAINKDLMLIYLGLLPDTFERFWIAAEAADNTLRWMDLDTKPGKVKSSEIITKATLIETMPSPMNLGPELGARTGIYIPGRVHPVVAELRIMREKLYGRDGLWMLIAFVVIVAANFIVDLLRSIFRSFG